MHDGFKERSHSYSRCATGVPLAMSWLGVRSIVVGKCGNRHSEVILFHGTSWKSGAPRRLEYIGTGNV